MTVNKLDRDVRRKEADGSLATVVAMIGEQEAALWRQAEESAGALDVYLDWLLIHDPVRGELLRMRMQNSELTDGEGSQERGAWLKALGLDDVCESIECKPLPRSLIIDAQRMAPLEPVLDQLPFLHITLEFPYIGSIAPAFAPPRGLGCRW